MGGLFITFEGGEGSGKTTQISLLKAYFERKGHEVITTREPGGTDLAEKLRELIVQRGGGDWLPMSEVLLLFTARLEHIERKIKPALAEGKIVISDRFTDSTYAYQGFARGLDMHEIDRVRDVTIGSFGPDMTFYLDIDTEQGLERTGQRDGFKQGEGNAKTEDRFERLDVSFHEKVRQGFLTLAKNEPQRIHVIDACQSVENVSDVILKVLEQSHVVSGR